MLRNFCFPAKQNIPSIVSIVQTEKVILLTYEYPPTRGGAGIYCEELGYAASDIGFNLEVWPPLGSASSTEVESSPLPFEGSQGLLSSFRLMLETRRRIKNLSNPFLLHLAEPGALRAFLRFRSLLKPLPPYLVTIHGSELIRFTKHSWERLLFRKTLSEAKLIHVLSSYNQKSLLQFCPESRDLIKQIPGAAARNVLPQRDPVQQSERTVKILCVGRIHPRKGQDKLIKAVNQLPEHLRKKIELCFVGPVVDQSFRRNIEQDANRTSCEIHFLGELSDKELREQYKRADLFSLTSMPRKNSIEGFGFVYLEASSHGLPILAHRVGGVEDAVGHEETGLLVDPLSETDLCHSLERLVSDNHLRSKLGEQGRRWANRHSWKRVAEKLYGES